MKMTEDDSLNDIEILSKADTSQRRVPSQTYSHTSSFNECTIDKVIFNLSSDDVFNGTEICLEDAQRLVNQFKKEELKILVPTINRKDVPTTHPRMLEISFYDGRNVNDEEVYIPGGDRVEVSHSGEVSLDQLFHQEPGGDALRLVAIIGEAGAGKTTISRRIAKTGVCFHLEFMQMGYGDRDVSLQEVILENFYHLKKREAAAYFDWMQKNQSQYRIVIDGLDQAPWDVSLHVPALNISSSAKIGEIIGNLLNGNFLPDVEIVITSRSHTMRLLHIDQRPQKVVMLNGFSPEDSKMLFTHFVGDVSKWAKLEEEAPQLALMCSNPAMLIYISAACCSQENRQVRSLTSVLDVVLADIRQSDHVKNEKLSEILKNVHSVAYRAVDKMMILISSEELNKDELTIDDVQDLTIVLPLFHGNSIPTRLMDGNVKVFFNHQTLQEYFAALYAVESLKRTDFREFVKSKLFTENWYMVRRFMSGRLLSKMFNSHYGLFKEYLDVRNSWKSFITFSDIALMFKPPEAAKGVMYGKKLLSEFDKCGKLITSRDADQYKEARRQFIRLLLDVRECDNLDITMAIADHFPTDVDLSRTPLTSNDAHAFSYVVQHVTKHIDSVNVKYCDLTTQQLELFLSGIRKRNEKIGTLHIDNNSLDSAGIGIICEVLNKVDRFLTMGDCFKDEHSNLYRNLNDEERATLEAALFTKDTKLILSVGGKKDIIRKPA